MISSNKILTLKNYHILWNKYFPQGLMNDESSNTWFDKQQFFSLKYILDDHVLTRCFGFQVKRNMYRRIIRLVGRDTGKWRGVWISGQNARHWAIHWCTFIPSSSTERIWLSGNSRAHVFSLINFRSWQSRSNKGLDYAIYVLLSNLSLW